MFYALRAQGSAAVVPARRQDHDQVLSLIERFEGPATAQLAEGWLAEQPDALSVVRDGEGVAAFAYHVLHPTGSAMEHRDPVVRAVLDHVAAAGPVRPGEQVDIVRFLSGRREHQRDPYAVLAGPVSSLLVWVSRPLAWSFVVVVDAAFWGPFFDYLAFGRLLEVEVGGLSYVAYGFDWRRIPFDRWLDLMTEREHSGGTGPPPASLLRPPPLDRARFAAAVRSALADLHRPDRLAASPLMGSSLATAPGGPSADRLRVSIEDAIGCLGTSPRATCCGPCCSARSSAPPRPRRPPPRCSACPSAPTGATWPRRSSSSPTCCGRWRSARCGCRRHARAAIEQQLSTV